MSLENKLGHRSHHLVLFFSPSSLSNLCIFFVSSGFLLEPACLKFVLVNTCWSFFRPPVRVCVAPHVLSGHIHLSMCTCVVWLSKYQSSCYIHMLACVFLFFSFCSHSGCAHCCWEYRTERPTDELGRDGIFQLMSSYPSNGTGVQAHGLSSLEVTQGEVQLFAFPPFRACCPFREEGRMADFL